MLKISLTLAAAAMFIGGVASAATISHTGDFQKIAAPMIVDNDTPASNDFIQYFDERQNFLLTADLQTDQGMIAAGTRVDSHMFFLNREDNWWWPVKKEGTLSFATDILGTMTQIHGKNLVTSDFLGFGTYANYKNRGLEKNDALSISGNTIASSMLVVTQPGDWVRVVTLAAVPLPAALPMLLAGLGGFGVMARRKKRQA